MDIRAYLLIYQHKSFGKNRIVYQEFNLVKNLFSFYETEYLSYGLALLLELPGLHLLLLLNKTNALLHQNLEMGLILLRCDLLSLLVARALDSALLAAVILLVVIWEYS